MSNEQLPHAVPGERPLPQCEAKGEVTKIGEALPREMNKNVPKFHSFDFLRYSLVFLHDVTQNLYYTCHSLVYAKSN